MVATANRPKIRFRRLIRSPRQVPVGGMLSSVRRVGRAKLHRTRWRSHHRRAAEVPPSLYDGCAPFLCICSAVFLLDGIATAWCCPVARIGAVGSWDHLGPSAPGIMVTFRSKDWVLHSNNSSRRDLAARIRRCPGCTKGGKDEQHCDPMPTLSRCAADDRLAVRRVRLHPSRWRPPNLLHRGPLPAALLDGLFLRSGGRHRGGCRRWKQ